MLVIRWHYLRPWNIKIIKKDNDKNNSNNQEHIKYLQFNWLTSEQFFDIALLKLHSAIVKNNITRFPDYQLQLPVANNIFPTIL